MLFQKIYPYALVKFDQEQEEPVRNAEGLCIEVAKGKSNVHSFVCIKYVKSHSTVVWFLLWQACH